MRSATICGAGVILLALPLKAQDLSPEVLKVAKAMTTNRDLLKSLPLYTCLETIDRTRPISHGQNSGDLVQVDVATNDTQEMYSWPGDSSFSALNLPDMVGHGWLSTGMFSGFAKNLFVTGNGIVQLAGEGASQGRPSLHFTFRVPSLETNWHIDWQGKSGVVGEGGDFRVDAQDFHLLRLQVVASDIPPQMQLHSLTLIMDYEVVPVREAATLMPVHGALNAVDKRERYTGII